MKKIFLILSLILILFTLAACDVSRYTGNLTSGVNVEAVDDTVVYSINCSEYATRKESKVNFKTEDLYNKLREILNNNTISTVKVNNIAYDGISFVYLEKTDHLYTNSMYIKLYTHSVSAKGLAQAKEIKIRIKNDLFLEFVGKAKTN